MTFVRPHSGSAFFRVLVWFVCVGFPAPAKSADAESYKWSVQYLIDNSQLAAGRSQKVFPRRNRGLALSPDGRFLYAGYSQSFNGSGEVRKIDVRTADFENATVTVLPGHSGKAIAVDDAGRVYLADGNAINIFDADLSHCVLTIPTGECEGVAVSREEGGLVLYGTDLHKPSLSRWVLQTGGDGGIAGAKPDGFNGHGELAIAGAQSLRGVAVDGKKCIWIADTAGQKVFRVNRDGSDLRSVSVRTPLMLACEGECVFATGYIRREISVLDTEMRVVGTLRVPWEQLQLSPDGNNHTGALAGIAVMPNGGGFFVADEGGQTANQKSTYGRTDQNSDAIDGAIFTDAFLDDNDPILRAVRVVAGDSPSPALAIAQPGPPAAAPQR